MRQKIFSRMVIYLFLSICLLATLLPFPVSSKAIAETDILSPGNHLINKHLSYSLDPNSSIAANDFIAIASGDGHNCALNSSGGVKCWGSNISGELGDGTMIDRSSPVDVVGMVSGINAITGGGSHTCALTFGGGVKCWGSNSSGQLGDGTNVNRNTPVDVVGLSSGVSAIAAGGDHTCALTVAGGVKCWGLNYFGQLGDGTTIDHNTPVDVVGLNSGINVISTGLYHTCGLTSAGAVKCWGRNYHGNLGDGTTTHRNVPVDVIGLTVSIIDLTTGYHHTCGLTSTGGIKCWGDNEAGQLGDGTWGNDRTTPVDVIGLSSGIGAFAAGGYHTCSQSTAGGIKCWGANWYGQLGDGTTMDRSTPVNVVGLSSGMTSIDAGYAHTCSLISDGGAKCWGMNSFGTLGDGTFIHRSTPVDVVGLEEGVQFIGVGGSHICALIIDGGVKCWGFGLRCGDGTETHRSTPVDVVGLSSGVKVIDAGNYHTCSVTTSGSVKCWGHNYSGVLGDGTTIHRNIPVDVVGLSSGISTVSAGGEHTCALTISGGVKCWGWNGSGQLGDGTTNQSTTPVDVVGMSSGVSAISAGSYHTCILSEAGGVKCWGDNEYGQLGDGTTDDRSMPVDVLGLSSGVKAISAGVYHTCALTEAGGVKCWGDNEYGQLGDGTAANQLTPVEMSGMSTGVIAVTSGSRHTCILTTGGGVKCTGANESGQLGDGTTNDRLSPIDVVGISSGAISVDAGFGPNTCVLVGSSRPKCWGADSWGQLGVGTVIQRLIPVDVIESPPPSLTTNYSNGQPGSSITITGWDFPPESEATLTINGEVQSSTVSVSPTGSFIVFLDTTGSDEGSYFVTASVNPNATTSFILADGAPLRLQEGGGQTFEVPPGIAYDDFVYLPLLNR